MVEQPLTLHEVGCVVLPGACPTVASVELEPWLGLARCAFRLRNHLHIEQPGMRGFFCAKWSARLEVHLGG